MPLQSTRRKFLLFVAPAVGSTLTGCASERSHGAPQTSSLSTPHNTSNIQETAEYHAIRDITLINNTGHEATLELSITFGDDDVVFSDTYVLNDLEAVDISGVFDNVADPRIYLVTVTVNGKETYQTKMRMGPSADYAHHIVDVKENSMDVQLAEL